MAPVGTVGEPIVVRGHSRAAPRGLFSGQDHTQYKSHCLRMRNTWTVPVILGDRIPRCDRGEEEREMWARMVMILFIPWRNPSDLKAESESWLSAYERQRHVFTKQQLGFISQMNILSECRDVRDEFCDS
ncbi:hypothetical protein FKP32DRAFT_1580029 [Trametes sanguinea]|nr:hypothetical protein FKP32DRAFT_1580029 [Trametes sanguinea]